MRVAARLRDEAADARAQIARRHGLARLQVHEIGDRLHRLLGPFGIVAAGMAGGFLFDRLKPQWRGMREVAGLGMSLLKLSPVMQIIGDRVSALLRD